MTGVGNRVDRNQTLLLFAFTVSTAGDWLYRLALPLLVLKITGSAVGAAMAYALEYLPYLFFSLVGGVAADRVNRLRLLIGTDVASAATVAVLAGLLAGGMDDVWLVFLVAFALSSLRPVYHPAFQSLLPTLVPTAGLAGANSRIQAIDSFFVFAGPVLGVGAVTALGTTNALWLDAGSFVLSALALGQIRASANRAKAGTTAGTATGEPAARTAAAAGEPAARTAPVRRRVRDDIAEALRYLRRDRITLTGSLVMTVSAAGIMMVEANLIFYVVDLLALPVAAVGIVLAANGLGSVLGALAAPRLLRSFRPGRLIATALFGTGVFTAILSFTPHVAGMAVLWGCVGVCVTVVVVAWFTLRQRIVPERLLGRVVATSRALAFAATPVGALLGAWLLTRSGVGLTVGTSAAIQVAAGLAAFATALGAAAFPPEKPERPTGTETETEGAAGVGARTEAQADARAAAGTEGEATAAEGETDPNAMPEPVRQAGSAPN